jgi:hypothetical protein
MVWPIIGGMIDADPQPSGTPTPGESSDAPLAILTPDVDVITPPSAYPEYLQPPRLGIIHLLAWMTVAAVLFKYDVSRLPPNHIFVFKIGRIIGVVLEILNAAGLVGFGVLLLAKIRRIPGHFQPGHWLLLYACLKIIELKFTFPLQTALSMYLMGTSSPFTSNMAFFAICNGLIEIAAFLLFASLIPEHGRWRVFFRLWALGISLPLLLAFIIFLCYPNYLFNIRIHVIEPEDLFLIIQSLLLLVFTILDLICHPKRDWLHWLGIFFSYWALSQVPIILLFNRLDWL